MILLRQPSLLLWHYCCSVPVFYWMKYTLLNYRRWPVFFSFCAAAATAVLDIFVSASTFSYFLFHSKQFLERVTASSPGLATYVHSNMICDWADDNKTSRKNELLVNDRRWCEGKTLILAQGFLHCMRLSAPWPSIWKAFLSSFKIEYVALQNGNLSMYISRVILIRTRKTPC